MIAHAVAPTAERRIGAAAGAAVVFVVLTTIASRNGGYFPTSFGWVALVLAWCTLLLVVLGETYVTTFEVTYLGALSAFVAWIWITAIWSHSLPASILEGERDLGYVAAVAALVVAARRIGTAALVGGLVSSCTAVCAYSLTTRLFPDRIGNFDPIATYRLSTPVGYWNSLGLFAAIGSLLALGVVARSRSVVARALAAAAVVVLLSTLYFTFSRGAWLALALALVALIALDPRRLQLCVALLVTAPAPAVAVLLASRSHALTTQGAKLSVASHQGHRVAVAIVVLAVVAALLVAALHVLETRTSPPDIARRAFAAALVAVLVAGCAAVVVHSGSPWHIAKRGWHGFVSAPPLTGSNLNNRLFHLSNNGRIVSWKSAYHEFESAPIGGTGAGTFETWWLSHRPLPQQIRDAHSLYVETMGELGIVGLILLVAALLVPFAAAVRRRRDPFVPFAAAAFLAWVVHAGVDWDWEIPAVTLAAFACGVVCVAGWGRREWRLGTAGRAAVVAAAVAVAGFGLVAVIGNQALASSNDALAAQNYAKADSEAKRAARWAPWSSQPWIIRGQLDALNQNPQAARRSFRTAIAHDPRDYLAWFGLAGVEHGAAKKQAVAEVERLNPLSAEAGEFRP